LLQRISDTTGESAHLAVLADDQVLYIDRVDSPLPLRVDRPAGTLAPLHTTALGKIFLAYDIAPLPAIFLRPVDGDFLARDHLLAQLRQIVISGYAIDDEEFSPGIRCVAAPLRDGDVIVAALGLSGAAARIDASRLEKLGQLVAEIAATFPS
jgi:DNA-binding IclR family transcriptional regulator